jgi:membrane protein implicated in regulation of membrane protease activity
MILVLLLPSTA